VPRHMAVVLTYPERVTSHNIEKLRTRIINGGAGRSAGQVLLHWRHTLNIVHEGVVHSS
jgi:DNA-directed RNA polymerase beta' subunit